jgi:predicted RNA-binding protein with RPS1 domain
LADCLKKVSLAPKQKLANPWDTIEQKYPVGAKVKGRVVNLVPYGAFVDLEPGVEGLVHVTELSWTKRIAKPSDVLKADQEIEAVVLGISREEQKVSLGLRQLEIELEAPGVGVRRNSEPRDAGNTGATKAEAHGNGASAHVKAESRLIIVDGLNVMNYGRVRGARGIDLRTLLTALVAIAQTGRDFHCIFDAKTHPVLKRFQPSQLPALETLLRAHSHWFSLVTGGGEADYFILSQADAEGCSVLSNDKFADYENKFPWLSEDRLRPVKGKDGRKMQVQDQRIMRGWLIRGQVSIPQLRINQAVEGDLNVLLERLGAALSALAPAAA